jgi:hypothetical protein
MIITVEVKKENNIFKAIDMVPAAVVVHAHDALSHLESVINELKTPDRQAMGGGTSGVSHGLWFCMRLYDLNRDKLALFTGTYANFLYANFKANPLDYGKGYEETLNNMKFAIVQGTFNKDSDSFKQTCKALKIKNTYKAIDEFLERVK